MMPLPVADQLALHELFAEHWARVDRIVDAEPTDLFAVDGVMTVGTLTATGHDGLAAYYVNRRASEAETGRRVRHLMSNLQVVAASADEAELRFLITVFAGRGEMPFASAAPSTIADFTASCRRDAGGEWRIVKLHGTPIFVGPDAPPNVRG